MRKLKILILLTYYERPNMVKETLRSILSQDYPSWELAFIDDGSNKKGKPIVERIMKSSQNKILFFDSEMSTKQKNLNGGKFIGKYMNDAIKQSDAKIAVMICDDDQFVPNYFHNLNNFFQTNPSTSCYSNVYTFDPFKEKAKDTASLVSDEPDWKGNEWFGTPIFCANKVDGSQVAWKIECNKVFGAWFKYPILCNHDASFFEELNARCGPTVYNGFISQYKAIFDDQLIKRIWRGDEKVLDLETKEMMI